MPVPIWAEPYERGASLPTPAHSSSFLESYSHSHTVSQKTLPKPQSLGWTEEGTRRGGHWDAAAHPSYGQTHGHPAPPALPWASQHSCFCSDRATRTLPIHKDPTPRWHHTPCTSIVPQGPRPTLRRQPADIFSAPRLHALYTAIQGTGHCHTTTQTPCPPPPPTSKLSSRVPTFRKPPGTFHPHTPTPPSSAQPGTCHSERSPSVSATKV